MVRRYALAGTLMLTGIWACSKHAGQPTSAVQPSPVVLRRQCVVKQSSVALSQCRGGYMNGILGGGVGYQLPAKFVAVLNGILSVFTKYRVTGTGHLFEVPGYQFMQIDEDFPTGCAAGAKT